MQSYEDLKLADANFKVVKMPKPRRGVVDVVLGAQWGDEGKGKLVDILSSKYSICARVAGGSNAGHTIVVDVRQPAIAKIIAYSTTVANIFIIS